jgi:hypothetical protein
MTGKKAKEVEEEVVLDSDDDEDEDEDMDFMEFGMGNLLSTLLTSEEGDNVCTALVKVAAVLDRQLATTNKLLVKIACSLKEKK